MDTGTISLIISVVMCIIGIITFFLGRKDKSNTETEKNSYNQGKIDQTLANIMEKLDKIEKKLDTYDIEIDNRIEKALKQHIQIYHEGAK